MDTGSGLKGKSAALLVRATYGAYAWAMLLAAAVPTLILLLVTPNLGARRRDLLCRRLARRGRGRGGGLHARLVL